MVVAIHQPNFFPWLGFFDKIARADVFVVLDDVQFPKSGRGTWINRVKMLIGGRPAWITVPIKRNFHGVRSIREIEIDDSIPWRATIAKTLQFNYSKCPFFKSEWPIIDNLLMHDASLIWEFNLHAITTLVAYLNLDPEKLVLGSSLKVEGKATELLIGLTKAAGGNTYLCGGGAAGYQQDELFDQSGLTLKYQDFAHPFYQQSIAEFAPGLSIVDALFNTGKETVRSLFAGGS